jgi:hypothetical protein
MDSKKGCQGDGDEPRALSEVTLEFLQSLNGRDNQKVKKPKRVGNLEREKPGFLREKP